jgi:hypothetical protein
MRSVWNSSTVISLLSAAAIACDSTGPDPADLTDMHLDFCASDTPLFVALKNEGENWARVTPDAQGTVAFQATRTLILAIVHQRGGRTVTEYIHATPDDLESLNGVSCIERVGTKTLNGSVAGVPVGSGSVVTMANSAAFLTAPEATFSLTDLPNGPFDLIAHREVIGTASVAPDRVIIRRAQDRTTGSAIPVLDFSSTEAVASAQHTVTAAGLSSNDINEFLLTFNTPTTRRHSLSEVESFTSNTRTLYGIPASLTQSGDVHELEVFADAGTAYRGEVQYYREPGNRTTTLGAHLSNPSLTFIQSSTQLRPRTVLPSQLEYGALVSVSLLQDTREVVITMTSGYHGGTPVTWDIHFPDLSAMPGFPTSARLLQGNQTAWYVDAYNGSAAAFFGGPADGATLRFAGRSFETSGAIASARMERARGATVTRRSRLGGR